LYGHISRRGHVLHLGFLAIQWYLPKSTSEWWSFAVSSSVNIFSAALSVWSGSLVFTIHSLLRVLCTCVSTARYGAFVVTHRYTFAVFIQTPGSLVSSFIVWGIFQLYIFTISRQVWWMFFDFPLNSQILLICSLITSSHIFIPSSGDFRYWKNVSFTLFTHLSVAWADMMIAIRSWKLFSWSSSISLSPYILKSSFLMISILSLFFTRVLVIITITSVYK